MQEEFYQFSARLLDGREVIMENFRGQTLLVVNTASKCGFTPQYDGLEKLYRKYRVKGLVVLGFPCNQFANQEPDDENSIAKGCVLNYGISFPMFSKVEVNGKHAHPIYRFLKKRLPDFLGGRIKWNFTKFLIDAEGRPIRRFSPGTTPEKIDKYMEKILG